VSTVEEIKNAIEQLTLSNRSKLERWLHKWQDDDWDEQIVVDASAGKLDRLCAEVEAELEAGKLRELP
jgi:hypothetical protein